MTRPALEPAERIAAALESIAHSLAVGAEQQRDKRRKALAAPKARRQHRPAPTAPVDDLARARAEQALRRLGR